MTRKRIRVFQTACELIQPAHDVYILAYPASALERHMLIASTLCRYACFEIQDTDLDGLLLKSKKVRSMPPDVAAKGLISVVAFIGSKVKYLIPSLLL